MTPENLYYFGIGFCLIVGSPLLIALIGYIVMERNIKDGLAEWYDNLKSTPWVVWGIGVLTTIMLLGTVFIIALIIVIMTAAGKGISNI